jgi:hypothetical protein
MCQINITDDWHKSSLLFGCRQQELYAIRMAIEAIANPDPHDFACEIGRMYRTCVTDRSA